MTPPRIYKVRYRGRRRVATVFVKVPYGGLYGMTELLTRMLAIGQVRWFSLAPATPVEIGLVRDGLQRWLPALTESSSITGVDWTA